MTSHASPQLPLPAPDYIPYDPSTHDQDCASEDGDFEDLSDEAFAARHDEVTTLTVMLTLTLTQTLTLNPKP